MSVQEVEGAGEEGAQQQQQQLGPYLGRPEQVNELWSALNSSCSIRAHAAGSKRRC